ncbi:MAG TPA: TonB family protein [Vicinamibacterales bacterium]|nr:TonB family protein [Vicinamibacterales bacterium]
MRWFFLIGAVASMAVLTPRASAAQDPLAAARDLYAAAAYEDALAALEHLPATNAPADRFAINQYRAFCLLALGRTAEAEQAIESVLSDRPLYHPSAAEASPRLRSAFTAVRQRMLPAIAQDKYKQAKKAFDEKDFAAAEAGFGQVLNTLADPDLSGAAARPPLADLATLAAGFRDLSARSVAAALEAARAQAAKAAKEEPPAPLPVPAGPPVKRIFSAGEPNVVLPVTVRQDFPAYPRDGASIAPQGSVEIVIDETGVVESAIIRSSMNARYDQIVLGATKNWRYQPATLGGAPVKFRKMIAISVKPAS